MKEICLSVPLLLCSTSVSPPQSLTKCHTLMTIITTEQCFSQFTQSNPKMKHNKTVSCQSDDFSQFADLQQIY